MIDNKKILILISHPDDEIIFCWPILQNITIEKIILTVSSDIYNDKIDVNRLLPLKTICDATNSKMISLDYDSDFYKIEGWPKTTYKQLHYFVKKQLEELDYDYVMTHNPFGEYGHPDHVLCFNMALLYSKKPILYTDISVEQPDNWWYGKSENLDRVYFREEMKIGEYFLDQSLYKFCENEYRKYGIWTWVYSPKKNCNLYKI